MSTPTPRTDAATALTSQHRHDDSFGDIEFGWVTAGFARTLERELSTITAERDQLRAELDAAKEKLRTEAVDDYSSIKELQYELAAEREKVRELSVCNTTGAERLAHATAQLAAERARLDWLDHNAIPWTWMSPEKIDELGPIVVTWKSSKPLRAAIDAAMKEDAK